MTNSQTLAERMTGGRIPAAEALSLAVAIAGRLSQWHSKGECHGALSPSSVILAGSTVELRTAAESGVTRYSAPEVVLGEAADKRSDIFSFGVIVYEMFTGAQAFAGDAPEDWREALLNEEPKPYGCPLLDRLLTRCLAKYPEGRFASAQRLQLELSLLSSAVRRGASIEPPAAEGGKPALALVENPAPAVPPDDTSRELHSLEARIASRMEEQERSIAAVERIASEVLQAIREGGLPAPPRAPAEQGRERRYFDYDDPATARLDRAFALLSEKVSRIDLAVTNTLERLERFEESLEVWDGDAAALRDSVTRDIRNFERSLKTQGAALDSVRTAMAQTDDLVERVVEALDSLQSTFVPGAEERKAS